MHFAVSHQISHSHGEKYRPQSRTKFSSTMSQKKPRTRKSMARMTHAHILVHESHQTTPKPPLTTSTKNVGTKIYTIEDCVSTERFERKRQIR